MLKAIISYLATRHHVVNGYAFLTYMVSFCSLTTIRRMMEEMMVNTKQTAKATSSAPTVNQLLQRGMQVGMLLLLSRKNLSAHLNSLWSPGVEMFTQLRPDTFLSFRPSINFDSNIPHINL